MSRSLGLFVPTFRRSYNKVQSAVWIRALQMVMPLKALGWDVSINNPFKRYDVSIFHRGMRFKSLSFINFLKTISKRVYWDTCVDYFYEHEAANRYQVFCSRLIAQSVDGVCVPTQGVASSASTFNSNIHIMPDPINVQMFSPIKNLINYDDPIFGWSGVSHKAKYLDRYAQFLDGRCLIISNDKPNLTFNYTFKKWTYEDFVDSLLLCDVGFLPRTLESSYTINNSSFKALVFAVLGLPIIANQLPSYQELSNSYHSISFLENHNYCPVSALSSLKSMSNSVSVVRQSYDRYVIANDLSNWISS